MTLSKSHCAVCEYEDLESISEFSSLPRATSDSRPWPSGGKLAVCNRCGAIQKIPDAKWLEETDLIYGNYDIYHQSAGCEQLIFLENGGAAPRSKRLVDHIIKRLQPPDRGKILDVGCGNGATLGNFSRALPNWALYGSELSDATLSSLRRIHNFTQLFVGPLSNIKDRFSIISFIHTLEHIHTPREALAAAAVLLEERGTLFVEVPDVETSPFDLLVADHLLHFSRATLGYLATRSGLRPLEISNELIGKEITLLASREVADRQLPSPEHGIRLAKQAVAWLVRVVAQAETAASGETIGIFGTAIAGMALYGALRDRVAFFVDEDMNRVGRDYDGKPVFSIAEAPKNVPVFIAMPPQSAVAVARRCSQAGLRCIVPPNPAHSFHRL
jgi:SAM-dependent methyltransferase